MGEERKKEKNGLRKWGRLGLWLAQVPGSRLFCPSLLLSFPCAVSSLNTTESPHKLSHIRNGWLHYSCHYRLSSHNSQRTPTSMQPRQEGEGQGLQEWAERGGMREREGGGNGAEREERELKIDLRDWGQKRHGRRKNERGWGKGPHVRGCLSCLIDYHKNTDLKTGMHMRRDCVPVRSTGVVMSLTALYPDCGLWSQLGGGHGWTMV